MRTELFRPMVVSLASLGGLALSGGALAQEGQTATVSGPNALSADPEMVFFRYGHNAIPGVHVPDTDVKNTVRVGMGLQYTRNPVVGYRMGTEIGAIVQNRINAQVGISWDFAEWGTARAILPVNANWGSAIAGFEGPGPGLGDIMVGASFLPYKSKWFNFGLRGDLFLPSGRSDAYMGEQSVRGNVGVTAMGNLGPVDLVADAAVLARPVLVSDNDFDLGPELVLSEALRLKLPWIPVNFTQTLIARGGFTRFFQGGAENGLELLGGLQVPLRDVGFNTDVMVDVMAGRGTNQGFGTTDLRVLAAMTITRNPGRKPQPEVVKVERPPPTVPPPVIVVEEDDPEKKAVERVDAIEIREPIEFFVNTANIRPESLGVLRDVAEIMNNNATIKHLVVEGHASAEGAYDYNYELSKQRAESVWKQLILEGVAPDRVSFRGMGEVRPKVDGDDEEAYQQNRRVEFKIVSRFNEFDEFPDYGQSTQAPWDGDKVRLQRPLTPAERDEMRVREQQQRDADRAAEDFRAGQEDDGFSFEEEPSPDTERTEADLLEDASFDTPEEEEDFEFDGGGSGAGEEEE